jgi:hypothetical protein
MLRELPDDLQCACVSRTLPPDELGELTFKGRLTALDHRSCSSRTLKHARWWPVARAAARLPWTFPLHAAGRQVWLRVIQSTREANPSPAIRSLVGPLLR